MTINFPKTLPYPTVQGYAIKPGEAIVRTEMEAGPARQRRRYTQTPSRVQILCPRRRRMVHHHTFRRHWLN